jgi:hypothetical protein
LCFEVDDGDRSIGVAMHAVDAPDKAPHTNIEAKGTLDTHNVNVSRAKTAEVRCEVVHHGLRTRAFALAEPLRLKRQLVPTLVDGRPQTLG